MRVRASLYNSLEREVTGRGRASFNNTIQSIKIVNIKELPTYFENHLQKLQPAHSYLTEYKQKKHTDGRGFSLTGVQQTFLNEGVK